MRTLLYLLIILILFSGCTREVKKIYVEPKYPKLRVLYSVPVYEITDFKSLGSGYIEVNATQLREASTVSSRVRRNLKFYEEQTLKYNREFVK